MHELTLFFLRAPERTTEPTAAAPAESRGPCGHDWQPVAAPPDAGSPWFLCSRPGCRVYGYRKRGRGPVRAYRCSVKGCGGLAVTRLVGRLVRGSMIWRCAACRS